jgi:hypothetical protein
MTYPPPLLLLLLGQVSEDQLKGMLEQLAERDPPKASKVTIQRRRPVFEDDL